MVTVSVIVFSYNRPRMLTEALKSIVGADDVCIVDDGSDFDIAKVIADSKISTPSFRMMMAKPMTVEDRLVTARFGKNTNRAVRESPGDVIAYLCDDDLFHPSWVPSIKEAWRKSPDLHWAKGEWGVFDDGQTPVAIDQRLCPMPQPRMTTGSFVHTKKCALECGLWWSEETVAVHDNYLINLALPRKHRYESIPLIGLAGWRREHAYNMLKYVKVNDYEKSAEDVLKRDRLE